MDQGYVEGITHDSRDHHPPCALHSHEGDVLTQRKRRHRHREFLAFLKHVDANVPVALDVHLIMDNDTTHKHTTVRAWLARRSRYHVHFTPTYATWLNEVERWFGLITQRATRRGSFRTVRELARRIDTFVTRYNRTATPFRWTATADSILATAARIAKVINGTQD
jgi:putative transposase